MSTYACFGMTPARALALGRDIAWSKIQRKGDYVPPAEHERLSQEEAEKIMAGKNVSQLSGKYDSPGPAFDYLKLAGKAGGKRLHVKGYVKSKERNEKTGKFKMEWIDI